MGNCDCINMQNSCIKIEISRRNSNLLIFRIIS